jgi:sulfatase modifying factor 1
MKHPIRSLFGLTILAGVSLVSPAFAVVNIDWVQVGNPGNGPDPLTGTLYGAVGYGYSIGKYEVTNAQYAEFLNAKGKTNAYGIFNETTDVQYGITRAGVSGSFTYTVDGGFENKPVNYVSWFDAARFTNWLGNGQGTGDTETGAYTLGGVTSGNAVAKNSGATVYVPSENEWYKAAYFDPTPGAGGGDNYWLYPTKSNTITTADANYNISVGHSTDVGTYALDPSFYGTFDQGGPTGC